MVLPAAFRFVPAGRELPHLGAQAGRHTPQVHAGDPMGHLLHQAGVHSPHPHHAAAHHHPIGTHAGLEGLLVIGACMWAMYVMYVCGQACVQAGMQGDIFAYSTATTGVGSSVPSCRRLRVSFSACPFSQRCMCRVENTCILGQGDVWVDPGMLTVDVLHCCVC